MQANETITPDGVLLVNKHAGVTSHDIVGKVRRLFGTRAVGHAGTLDPMATGVLVVLLGRAAKASEYLGGEGKRYFAHLRLGLTTDTEDTTGKTLTVSGDIPSPERVIEATRRIYDMGNIHVHLDLIAGLPYEGYARFAESFNEAYFCSDMLQLGFLKLLHGTVLRRDAEKYGYVSMSKAPYTVLATKWLSRDELYRLSRISDLLDRFYSSGRFARSLDFAVRRMSSPFAFYEGLLAHISKVDGRDIRKLSQTDAFRVFYTYAASFLKESVLAEFEELLHADYAAHEARQMPRSVIFGKEK